MARYEATPAKLKSGAWGARVRSEDVGIGDTLDITTRAGKSWSAIVSRVLWTGNGVAIVATESNRSRSSRRSYNGECNCGACEDLLSFGYRPGQRIRCPECGGWAEAY